MGQLGPSLATVGCLENPRARSSAPELPRSPIHLPEGCIQNVRVVRIHNEVNRTGTIITEEDFLPDRTAIGGSEYTTVCTRPERVAERRNVRSLRISRVHSNTPNRMRILQPEMVPGLSTVVGTVYPITLEHVSAELHFTHPNIDDVRIRLRDRHCTD